MFWKNYAPIVLSVSILLSACTSSPNETDKLNSGDDGLVVDLPAGELDEQPIEGDSVGNDENSAVPDWLLATDNPLNIKLTLDEGSRSSAEIGPEGGTLSLELADGTVFTLQIPRGALFSTEMIIMTSVSEMSEVNIADDESSIVDLGPHDLLFLEPVHFSVQIPDSIEADEITGFSTDGSGDNFHLIPSQSDGNRMETWLTHFSASGVFYASRGALFELQTSYTPTSAEARAMEQLAAIKFAVEDEEARRDAYGKILSDWMGHSILPAMTTATVNDQRLPAAIGEFLAWDQSVHYLSRINRAEEDPEFLEGFEHEYAALYSVMSLAFKNAIDRSYAKCVQDKDPIEALNLTSWALLAMNFSQEIFGMHGLDDAYIAEKARRCVSFDINFFSTVEGEGPDGNIWKTKVSASVNLELDKLEFNTNNAAFGLAKFFENSSTLYMDKFSVVAPTLPAGATCAYSGIDGEMSVNLGMPFTLFRDERSFDDLIMYIGFPVFPIEHTTCLFQGIATDFDVEFWMGTYSIAFDVGVSAQSDQITPRPVKSYREENAYVVHLKILNDEGNFAQGREAGQLNNIPQLYLEATYHVNHMPK